MTTATALIAEDEPLLARHLASQLAQRWPALRLLAVVDNGLDAATETLALRPQVCFLDIRMPGQSGLEAAQAIVEDWSAAQALPLLVFVTAYDQYAVQAFEAQAADYLLKSVTYARLAACVQRLQGRLQPALGRDRAFAIPGAAGPTPRTAVRATRSASASRKPANPAERDPGQQRQSGAHGAGG